MMLQIFLPVVATLLLATITTAFTPPSSKYCPTQQPTESSLLKAVIRGDDLDLDIIDWSQGGVGLAEASVIKIIGTIQHSPGKANPTPTDMIRYTGVREVSSDKLNGRIVCTGRGVELYKDPGEGTAKEVTLAPLDAVRDSMQGMGTTQDAAKVVINFLGGDDLQMREVLDACEQMVLNLDVKTGAKISFNSIAYKDFPADQAWLTVVDLPEVSDAQDLRGEEKALAEGEIYFFDGKYYTVIKEDITTAVA